jgi:hypothetical protein
MMGERILIKNGSLEILKWLGLCLMTGDHINKYLFNSTIPGLFEMGRMALPLFVFVLGYNLARPDALQNGVYQRTMFRLAITGTVASIPFVGLGGLAAGWWPLNVLFTLLTITATAFFIESGGAKNLIIASLLFLVGGSSVEYWWPSIVFGIATWSFCKKSSVMALVAALLSCLALWFINGNWWAIAAIPLLLSASQLNVRLPRLRWAFYSYYPIHLAILWLIRIPMGRAGYLFF